jgi:acetylcholinesterase
LNAYGIGELRDYVIRFTATLDPNGGNPIAFPWPKWNNGTKVVLEMIDGIVPLVLGTDTFRSDAIDFITHFSLNNSA